ncbi:uncharacterized protein LOC133856695 [Alnus glutinosa]|uniref:uncharacterized protein LOC133856695 n=1 Tax=Alnus glutinosa TaxID=3517 RepID=UPI002D78D39A|nr:uncharacterized protein LOC133856695 [Alnus glutinosa]
MEVDSAPEEPEWARDIIQFLRHGLLPENKVAARRVNIQAARFCLLGEILIGVVDQDPVANHQATRHHTGNCINTYGVSGDFMDEYLRIAENTATKCLRKFVKSIISIYSDKYLRSPNSKDITRLLEVNTRRGFPEMLGSIDCMHWKWKNCPKAWAGSHNDINVLEHSSLFTELAGGRAPSVNYSINNNDYTMGYYLADGIYPSWSTFVKTIHAPQGNKRKHFAKTQESVRKDVERAFGVLQARFAIVQGPTRSFDHEMLKNIMIACIILHNMIVEDERHL